MPQKGSPKYPISTTSSSPKEGPPLQRMDETSALTNEADSLSSEAEASQLEFETIIEESCQAGAKEALELIPDTNLWALGSYSITLPVILSAINLSLVPQSGSIGPTWAYLDAACQGLAGLQQLLDTQTHRPEMTKAKGLLNIASNIQLITLTVLGASTGAIGFAAAAGTLFLLSFDELIRQGRRLASSTYFFDDGLAELDKIALLIQEKKEAKRKLEALPPTEKTKKSYKLAHYFISDAVEKLETREKTLQSQLEAKLDIDLYEFKGEGHLTQLVKNYAAPIEHPSCQNFLASLKNREKPSDQRYLEAKKINKQTKNELKKEIKSAAYDTVLWAIAFTGLLLACLPGMQIASVALIAVAAAMVFYKSSKKVVKKSHEIYQFFKNEAGDEKTPLDQKIGQKEKAKESETEDEGKSEGEGEGESKPQAVEIVENKTPPSPTSAG